MAVTPAVGLNTRWHGEDEPQHYNSQAGTFSQAVRETHALMQLQGGTFESECIGLGDLYVTIFTRAHTPLRRIDGSGTRL